jgi:hypothetical protein
MSNFKQPPASLPSVVEGGEIKNKKSQRSTLSIAQQRAYASTPNGVSGLAMYYSFIRNYFVKTINLLMQCPHCSTTFEWGLRLTARARKNYGV